MPVDAQIILCDAAVADSGSGKMHMLGAGWSVTGTPTAPQAVAVMMKIPWDRANQKLHLHLRLLDADGVPIVLGAQGVGEQPVGTEAEVEVGRPPGATHGSPLDASFALTVPPMPLPPGRYVWQLDLAERTFSAGFEVRPA